MIDRGNVLPLTRQASLMQLSRSSFYYLPRPVPPARLAIMHRIDALHLEHPFAGNGKMRDELLNSEVFNTLKEAQVLIEEWRRHYNRVRPHSSLGYRPPAPETVPMSRSQIS